MDESSDVTFDVFQEPALSAPEAEDWNIWQEATRLRTENLHWRECVTAIARDVDRYRMSSDALRDAIMADVTHLGTEIAKHYPPHQVLAKTA